MSQMGLEPEAFFEIGDRFLKVVNSKITGLEEHIREESDGKIDLDDLTECATLLRAERVIHILDRLPEDTEAINYNPFVPILSAA